jgi:MoaA/NifB/PqqE/SkfB family radical SAM enzyme
MRAQPCPSLRKLRLDVGLNCPLRCGHCSASATPGNPGTLALPRAREFIEDFAAMGGDELTITGGEPLQYPATRELLSLARSHRLRTVVFSSGVVSRNGLPGPVDESQLKDLASLTDRLVINAFAADPTLHDAITGLSRSQAYAIETTRLAVAVGVPVEFHFVPMSSTILQLSELVDLAASLGVGAIRVIRFVAHGRASQLPQQNPTRQQLANLKAALLVAQTDARVEVRVGSAFGFMVDFAPHCAAGVHEVVISWNGSVYPCSGFAGYRGSEPLGNALETSLPDVWEHAPLLLAVRDLIFKRIAVGGGAKGCPAQKAAVAGYVTDTVADPGAPEQVA